MKKTFLCAVIINCTVLVHGQNSSIHADKITSHLLLYCGKQSNQEYQVQTTAMFVALRRLEKKAWWLQYENGHHLIDDPTELKDFTIRYTQFFDHYLKDAPAPKWMTRGLSYELKGIENRLELDPGGSCGENCKVCHKWNTKYSESPEMFLMPVAQWDD